MKPLQENNKGVMFPNPDRAKDTDPTHKGRIRIAGHDYWLAGWAGTSQNGNKYLSIVINDRIEYQRESKAPDDIGSPDGEKQEVRDDEDLF